jgi:hypothetical protein
MLIELFYTIQGTKHRYQHLYCRAGIMRLLQLDTYRDGTAEQQFVSSRPSKAQRQLPGGQMTTTRSLAMYVQGYARLNAEPVKGIAWSATYLVVEKDEVKSSASRP